LYPPCCGPDPAGGAAADEEEAVEPAIDLDFESILCAPGKNNIILKFGVRRSNNNG